MPSVPQGMCTAPGCQARVRKGRCPKHTTSKRDAFADVYSSRAWRAVRNEVMAEEPICRMCGMRASEQVDHIVALHDGGSLSRLNLQGLCRWCHYKKTKADRRRRGRSRAESPKIATRITG